MIIEILLLIYFTAIFIHCLYKEKTHRVKFAKAFVQRIAKFLGVYIFFDLLPPNTVYQDRIMYFEKKLTKFRVCKNYRYGDDLMALRHYDYSRDYKERTLYEFTMLAGNEFTKMLRENPNLITHYIREDDPYCRYPEEHLLFDFYFHMPE